MTFPGPDVLGRAVIVGRGASVPAGFPEAPRIVIDDAVVAVPATAADRLHRAWSRRERVVIELTADSETIRAPQTEERPPYELDETFDLHRARLHALIWANAYDARDTTAPPIWWHGTLAERRGASAGSTTDVVLPDGTAAWCDGGPREPLDVPTVHRESIQLGRLTPARHAEPADELAPDQLAAVTQARSAARIIAPAGSGKTRVLTSRLRHLLQDRGYEPQLVTALAYNTRAAGEMRDRTDDLGGAHIRTIHALGRWICQLEQRGDLIHERDVRGFLEPLLRLPRQQNTDPMAPYIEALAEVRLGLTDPETVEAARGDVDGFAEAFGAYRDRLRRANALDFDELVYHAIEVLLTRPDIRTTVQQRCQHLLVDEFQDLTPAFVLLIRLVAGPFAQVFGVGDDDQVIYGYAGATPRYLTAFGTYIPDAAEHALEVNYRCPPEVVTAATHLLAWNQQRIVKTIRASTERADAGAGADEPAFGTETVAADTQSPVAVAAIQRWLGAGTPGSDIAVLARVNSALLPIQVALTEGGVAHDAPLDASVLSRTGIRAALAWLRVGLDPERLSPADIRETLKRPPRKVTRAVEDHLRRGSRKWSLPAITEIADTLTSAQGDRLREYVRDIEGLTDLITENPDVAASLTYIRDTIGLGTAMDSLDASKTRPEGSSHGDDLTALIQLGALHPDPVTFPDWLRDTLTVPGVEDGVTLSTVHRVKGMEWPRVVVFGVNTGLFPHRLADDVEEERRILHVAITRCSEQVLLVADRDAVSPFLREFDRAPTAGEASAVRAPTRRPAIVAAKATLPNVATDDIDRDDPATAARFEALRSWRGETSRELGLPAYVVLHDNALWAIADRTPSDLSQLSRIPGIGPAKLERYGDDLLELIADLVDV